MPRCFLAGTGSEFPDGCDLGVAVDRKPGTDDLSSRMTEATQDKLDEARFFLRHLGREARWLDYLEKLVGTFLQAHK